MKYLRYIKLKSTVQEKTLLSLTITLFSIVRFFQAKPRPQHRLRSRGLPNGFLRRIPKWPQCRVIYRIRRCRSRLVAREGCGDRKRDPTVSVDGLRLAWFGRSECRGRPLIPPIRLHFDRGPSACPNDPPSQRNIPTAETPKNTRRLGVYVPNEDSIAVPRPTGLKARTAIANWTTGADGKHWVPRASVWSTKADGRVTLIGN